MATPKSDSFFERHGTLLVVLLVVSLLLGAFGFWLSQRFEKRWVKQYQPPSEEAQKQPFLALSRLLEPHGIKIDDQSRKALDIDKLPASNDVLFLTNGGERQSSEDQKRLMEWVDSGGRLVLVVDSRWALEPSNEESQDDLEAFDADKYDVQASLLDYWGITTSQLKYPDSFFESREQKNQGYSWTLTAANKETIAWHHQPYAVPYVGIHYEPDADTVQAMEMTAPPSPAINEPSYAIVQFRQGKGQVLLLNSDDWLTNEALDGGDNGYLALLLADSLKGGVDTTIRIFSSNPYQDTPNLLKWLWQRAPYALLAAALCLLLWLWRYRFISGPKLMPLVDTRRDLHEHLRATGWFIYRADKGVGLMTRLTKQFNQGIPRAANVAEFVAQTRHFQSLVVARFNQFNRYNPFTRQRQKASEQKEES